MPRESDQFLRNVRAAITQWKQSQLQNSVQDDQDTTKLNLFLEQTAVAYKNLKQYLESESYDLSDFSLSPILEAIGNKHQLSHEEEVLLREYLFRDLIEYPFTYNTTLINSFRTTNALNTKIVPNK
jgi:hypothetical protein